MWDYLSRSWINIRVGVEKAGFFNYLGVDAKMIAETRFLVFKTGSSGGS